MGVVEEVLEALTSMGYNKEEAKTTEEVQEIVRIANRYGIPLYPISTGKNLGYGGSAPQLLRQHGRRPEAHE